MMVLTTTNVTFAKAIIMLWPFLGLGVGLHTTPLPILYFVLVLKYIVGYRVGSISKRGYNFLFLSNLCPVRLKLSFGRVWVNLRSIMDEFWVDFGSPLVPLWIHSGSSLGPLRVHFWSTSGPLRVYFESTSGPL